MTPPTPTTRRQAFATAGLALFGTSLATSTRAAESSAAPSSHYLDIGAFVVLDADVAYAHISDNTSRAPFSVINQATGKTVIRDNLSET